jgi:hypothetical protein
MGAEVSTESAIETAGESIAEMQLGLVVAPVSEVDRAVAERAGEGPPT